MSATEGDIALRSAGAFVDELVAHGVEHACVSPGSRSTPIALALWRHPKLRVHVHLDERASAFFALGLAKATGAPVTVTCTSGTAAAELLPAAVEATMARVPLLLLTADRPPELRGVGANQTISQVELFGRHAKAFVEAAVPSARPEEGYWRELAREAVRAARRPPPGPVHLDLPFREPLVPSPSGEAATPDGRTPETATPEARRFDADPGVSVEQVETFVQELAATRGAVVAGSLRRPAAAVVELASRLGWPLIAEPTSGLRVPGALSAGQFLLSNERFSSGHAPEVIVQFGAAPTSRAGLSFVANARRLVVIDPDGLVADPARRAVRTLQSDPQVVAERALDTLAHREDRSWLERWLNSDARARAAVDGYLDGMAEPFEGRVARDLAVSLPGGSILVVGSSMPIRDLDAFMRPREGLQVLANRGASGIDGFVSTALGIAASGATTTAFCGDLTLLHDAGSLLWSARRGLDLVIVVPNNDGGVIFSFLPQRDLPELRELFTTPHGIDLGALCAAAGAGHALVEHPEGLLPSIEGARAAGGVHLVEIAIDGARNVSLHAEVAAVVDAALGEPTM